MMNAQTEQESQLWYVLNYVGTTPSKGAPKIVDSFNSRQKKQIHGWQDLELFAPTYVVKEEKEGKSLLKTIRLTFHYVFVKGQFPQVKQLCAEPNGFSFMIDRGSNERYATIPDSRMAHFKNIARAYKNCLPYFPLDDIDLEDGDLVEVVKGDFPGLVGHYIPNPKSKTGNILLNVYNKVGTVAFNVKATDVRVIEFSRRSTRANDQIDAFVPHLLKALRSYVAHEELPVTLAAKLSIFTGRLGIARLNNRKLDAKLQALLYAAFRLIGDNTSAEKANQRLTLLQDSVTNTWTRALITLILTILSPAKTHLPESSAQLSESQTSLLQAVYADLLNLEADSKAKTGLLTEYQHYLS